MNSSFHTQVICTPSQRARVKVNHCEEVDDLLLDSLLFTALLSLASFALCASSLAYSAASLRAFSPVERCSQVQVPATHYHRDKTLSPHFLFRAKRWRFLCSRTGVISLCILGALKDGFFPSLTGSGRRITYCLTSSSLLRL